jgi:hypothetical protein
MKTVRIAGLWALKQEKDLIGEVRKSATLSHLLYQL